MKQGQAEVKSKGKVVGVATFNIYDSIDEAISTIGDAAVLALINTQTKTNELNVVREGAQERVGKKMLEAKAMASITPEEFASVFGDAVRIRQLIEEKMKVLEAELKASQEAEKATT